MSLLADIVGKAKWLESLMLTEELDKWRADFCAFSARFTSGFGL
jgi:hypothetical protein